jgi:hypothetical protein
MLQDIIGVLGLADS